MIKTFIDFDGKMPYILVFGYSKAQMQKQKYFHFRGEIFCFFVGSQFPFSRMDLYTFDTTKMEMYIFAGRTLFTQQSQEKSFSHALSEFAI